ncbi:tRNA pseudouridine(55) synthase TruB [Cellulomonas composti]|uniref:tRNA pseudouridine synthase B n=1 Tax=Cellulomonas composti TaxID=266130 RepID=A0A511J9F0_9CELL|nr:tRNA pseudouridine(55) synthase TruB [Cellulomonas composti]GEL94323.1 tRNA pseudouridine synthase B [Cellulomonas composti]
MTDAPRRPTAPDGVVVVDKPAGLTSHDVVARMRRLAGTRKVGHAGTLDPMATGVLVVGIGRATRLLTYVVGADKDYDATIRLGVATSTEDAEGDVVATHDAGHVGRGEVERAVAALTGDILQVPSAVSAIKVDGRRAYERVRAGEDVELAARPARVSRFDVVALRAERIEVDGTPLAVLDVDVQVTVSSGTYVRALARDVGVALGVGAHLTSLRRTRVGGYGLDVARTLDELGAVPPDRTIDVLALAEAARSIFRVRALTWDEARALSYGQRLAAVRDGAALDGAVPDGAVPDGAVPDGAVPDGVADDDEERRPVAAIAPDGTLVALLERRGAQDVPLLVFAPA